MYSLTEILEYNDISEEEALQTLMDSYRTMTLPNPKPLDFDD